MHEFTEDINEDGKKEKIVFSNHYRFYDKMNVTDVGYTSNHIKIYIDNNKIYSQKLRTVSHLSEPEIVDIDSSKANTGIKHIFVKDKGGGDVRPLGYVFVLQENHVEEIIVMDIVYKDGKYELSENDVRIIKILLD